jgi:hypothetical protein
MLSRSKTQPRPWRCGCHRARAPGALSTFYVRRTPNRGGEPMLWRRWLKWLVVLDTDRQILLAQEASARAPITARQCSTPADHRYCSRGCPTRCGTSRRRVRQRAQPPRHVRERLGAVRVIPAKRGKATWWVQGYRGRMRTAFPSLLYRRGALVESVFWAVKRKLCRREPRGPEPRNAAHTGAALLGLAYNLLYRLRPCPI